MSFSNQMQPTEELVLKWAEMIHKFTVTGDTEEAIRTTMKDVMGFGEQAINLAFDAYHEHYSQSKSGTIITGKRYKDKLNWYNPSKIPDPNSRWGKLAKRLKFEKGWADEHINDLNEQSDDVVSSLVSPKSIQPDTAKGLVVGYVQSGKTTNFSAVIAKACDEGYNFVLVMSGTLNDLRLQTEKRLNYDLTAEDKGAFNLTLMERNGDFKRPTNSFDKYIHQADVTMAVVKKNTSPLKKLLLWLNEAEDLSKAKVLIIDDEADQASVNNARREGEYNAVHRCIRDIVKTFSVKTTVSYVGYTATPFANILIDANDEDDLFPRDFIVCLDPPSNYYGTEKLFGRATVDNDDACEGLDVIRLITEEDAISSYASLKTEITDSLKRAVCSFVLAGSERMRRKRGNQNITMLANTSQRVMDHLMLKNSVQELVTEIKYRIENRDPELISQFNEIWESDFLKVSKKMDKDISGNFEDLIDTADYFLKDLQVVTANSENSEFPDFETNNIKAIIVGGDKLSRGITIEGLTTSFFDRNSKGYDTLLQMGRWFGYRPGYIDLTRVFVSANTANHFYHLATVEHELREQIKSMKDDPEANPTNIALLIRDHDKLVPTNKNVFKNNSKYAAKTFSGTKNQASHIFYDNPEVLNHNFGEVKRLVSELEDKGKRDDFYFRDLASSYIYRDVNYEDILLFLQSFTFSKNDRKFDFDLLGGYIQHMVSLGELTNWSVALLSRNAGDEERRIDLGVKNISVYGVSRRIKRFNKSESDGSIGVDNLIVAQQELSDLGDVEPFSNYKTLTDFRKEKHPGYNQLRKFRPKDRGLLAIQPIYGNWANEQKWAEEREDLLSYELQSRAKNIFGVAVVLPCSKHSQQQLNYVTNATLHKVG